MDEAINDNINIVSVANTLFFPGLATTWLSTLATASGQYNYHFTLINEDIAEDKLEFLKEKLQQLSKKRGILVKVSEIKMADTAIKGLNLQHGSKINLAKLYIPSLFSQHKRLITLMPDMLVFRGIEGVHEFLYHNDEMLIGVRDYRSLLANDCPWINQLTPLEKKLPYINSGIMGLNIETLPAAELISKAHELCSTLSNYKKIGDQAAYNFVARGRVALVHNDFNFILGLGSAKECTEHFLSKNLRYIGKRKPWLSEPNCSEYIAHVIWHTTAKNLGISELYTIKNLIKVSDVTRYKIKSFSNIFNPARATMYKEALKTMPHQEAIRQVAQQYWDNIL